MTRNGPMFRLRGRHGVQGLHGNVTSLIPKLDSAIEMSPALRVAGCYRQSNDGHGMSNTQSCALLRLHNIPIPVCNRGMVGFGQCVCMFGT